MNERIKELAEQAKWKYIQGTRTPIESRDYVVSQEQAQKFAELIVKECLTFIEPTAGSGDLDDLAFEAATNEIKEHFGITS